MAAQKIRVNVPRQVAFLAVAAGCAGAAVWSVMTIDFAIARWGIAAVAAIAAFLFWGYGTGTAGVVACPRCGAEIEHVDPKSNVAVLCPHCMEFSTGTGGMLDATPEDYVAKYAAFGAHMPRALEWPDGCSVCQKPVTRMIESKLVDERPGSPGRDLAVGIASLGVLKAVDRTTYTIQAPHCAEHKDGVELVEPNGIEFPVAIAFRSYPYYKKFRLANTVPPIKLMTN